jgi:hypothetical protein
MFLRLLVLLGGAHALVQLHRHPLQPRPERLKVEGASSPRLTYTSQPNVGFSYAPEGPAMMTRLYRTCRASYPQFTGSGDPPAFANVLVTIRAVGSMVFGLDHIWTCTP